MLVLLHFFFPALVWLRGDDASEFEIRYDMLEIQQETEDILYEGTMGYWDVVSDLDLRRPLLIGVMLHLSHQWTGINVVSSKKK